MKISQRRYWMAGGFQSGIAAGGVAAVIAGNRTLALILISAAFVEFVYRQLCQS